MSLQLLRRRAIKRLCVNKRAVLKIPKDEPREVQNSLERSERPKWPANTNRAECIRRDKVLSDYIKGHDWFMSHEFHLLRKLIMTPDVVPQWTSYRDRYPLIFDLEWESDEGRGDLVCSDGRNNFLIVELKSFTNSGDGSGKTHRTTKRQKRRQGEEQTEKFAKFWHEKNPQVKKTVGVFVTEEVAAKQIELKQKDRTDTD